MDLLDPDTWKLSASLIDYWKTILVGGVAILTAVGTLLRWGFKPFRWAWSKIARAARPPNISRPLRFVQNERQSFWGPAKTGTQVVGRWQVTNISDRHIFLLRARLDGHPSRLGNVITEGTDGLHSSKHPVPAQHMTGVAVDFMFFPPIISGNEPLVADVIFTDNFEDEHRVPSRFRFIHGPY